MVRFALSAQSSPTGKDSSEAFEDVGHSDEARALLRDMLIGEFENTDVRGQLSFPVLRR